MSIIERALGKLQNATPPAGRTESSSAARPPRATARVEHLADQTGRHALRAKDLPAPAETIQVNIAELRAAGALPTEQLAAAITDQLRRIKWPVLESVLAGNASGEAHTANRVMVTSSIAAEGKTFISLNLACSFAREKDFSVLLVDADVAKRHISELFKLEDRQGLTDAVADANLDPESLVLGTSIAGLSILPAGRRTSSAPELFASQRMSDIVEQLGDRDERRIVLFDSSPLLLTNESQVLSKLVDQILMVVRAEFTAQPLVQEAVGLLDKKKQVRCILNQARASRMTEYYYGYGYYPNDRPRQE